MIYSQQIKIFVPMNAKQKIGQRIKELREENKITQKELSYTSDLDRSYIASVENGERNISIVNIEKIAMALGLTIKEFFNNDKFN